MIRTSTSQNRPGGFLARLGAAALAAVATIGLSAGVAGAAGTVQWNAPANGATFAVGTEVMPDGTATGLSTGGTGLDLALVLDGSGSMTSLQTVNGVTKSRLQWQAEAAVALVNSLPQTNTAVAVVRFSGSNATVPLNLTPTTSATDIVNAINAISASSTTPTAAGILAAETELNTNGTAGRSKQMVVISDGESTTGNPVSAAGNANTNSGITVHGVVIPGGSPDEMQDIANAGGGTFFDARTEQGLQDLISLFSGFGGSLVGVSQVDITMPDGTLLTNVSTDAFGNFKTPGWNMLPGDNVFQVTAFFDDQTQDSATLTLVGVGSTNPIPLPAAGWLLLSGLAGLGVARRVRRKS